MTVTAVFRDEFSNTVRSLRAGGLVFALWLLVGSIFVFDRSIYDSPLRVLWDVQMGLILVGPVLVGPLCYDAVVDARQSRRICFHLGLGVTRFEYLLGTTLARWVTVAMATGSSILVGYIVASLLYPTAPSLRAFLEFAVSSCCFVLAFAGLYVTLSAIVRQRASAMAGSLVLYLVFVPFVIGLPFVSLELLLRAVGEGLGGGVTDATVRLVTNLTPYPAYGGITQSVFEPIASQYPRLPVPTPSQARSLTALWRFDALVLCGWLLVPPAIACWRFDRSELV